LLAAEPVYPSAGFAACACAALASSAHAKTAAAVCSSRRHELVVVAMLKGDKSPSRYIACRAVYLGSRLTTNIERGCRRRRARRSKEWIRYS
jgi:hypothetical protein